MRCFCSSYLWPVLFGVHWFQHVLMHKLNRVLFRLPGFNQHNNDEWTHKSVGVLSLASSHLAGFFQFQLRVRASKRQNDVGTRNQRHWIIAKVLLDPCWVKQSQVKHC